MRLLHTSDWHLGQSFYTFERSYEHHCFFEWLLETLEVEQIDVLLIAGDIFDNTNPAAAAQRQFYRFLTAAKRRLPALNLVIIAGNHDSPGRLEAPIPLLEAFDVTVVGYIARDATGEIDLNRLVVPLRNRHQEIAAWCLAIPFLRPGDVPRVETAGDPYLQGVKLLYRQSLALALERQQPNQAIVALGHCHLSGGLTSEDSERRIVIGGLEALPPDMFDPAIAYVALGHLHRAQQIDGQARLRYAGSPLPMSFAETHYRHQVLCVDLDGDTVAQIQEIPIPRAVDLLRIPEQPAPIDEVLEQLARIDRPALALEAQPYLEVRVRLQGPEPGLRTRIETVLQNKAVRLARIDPSYKRTTVSRTTEVLQSLDDLGRLQPDDIFQKLHWQRYGEAPSADLLAVFRALLLASEREQS